MPRVKRGTIANKRRKNLLKHAKGFKWGRSTKYKAAKQALMKAWTYAYRDRRTKKRDMRQLQNVQINAAAREVGTKYSQLIHQLKAKNIELDRKVLAELAREHPETFKRVAEEALK